MVFHGQKLHKMKNVLLFLLCITAANHSRAQLNTENFIAGGKTLVELISVLKKGRSAISTVKPDTKDSCALKQLADLCFKNSSLRDLAVSLYRRIEASYEAQPFTVKVLPKKQECLYELKSGIYKYRIETDSGAVRILLSEGEFRLQPCDNMKRELKE